MTKITVPIVPAGVVLLVVVAISTFLGPRVLRAIAGKANRVSDLEQLVGMVVVSKDAGVTLATIEEIFGRNKGGELFAQARRQGLIVVQFETPHTWEPAKIHAYAREYQPSPGQTPQS